MVKLSLLGLSNDSIFRTDCLTLRGHGYRARRDQKLAETEAKVAMKKAEAKVYETEATSSMLMEQRLTDHMGDSIKDEIWTIWFVLVLTGCFLPWTQEYGRTALSFWMSIRQIGSTICST